MSLPKKKLAGKIRPVKNTIDPEQTWALLETGLSQIYNRNASFLSFEELYRNAYNMVLYKHGQVLYARVRTRISEYLNTVVQERILPIVDRLGSGDSATELEFLRKLKEAWEEHGTCLQMIRDVLMYLDRTLVKTLGLPDVYTMGQSLFRDTILLHKNIRPSIVASFLHQVDLERRGELVDLFLLKKVTEMLLDFEMEPVGRVYNTLLEEQFLLSSTAFYENEAQSLFRDSDVSEYFKRVEIRLSEEQERVSLYLATETLPKIILILEKQLLENYVKSLLEADSGLNAMISNKRTENLQRMYALLKRIPTGIPQLKEHLSNHLKDRARNINKSGLSNANSHASLSEGGDANKISAWKSDHLNWVESMLLLKDEFDGLLSGCFSKDRDIEIELNNTLETVINENLRSAEFISLFIDENLKKGLKGKSEEEVDLLLDKAIILFRFLREKDVFDRYYKQHLAKRLLFNKSVGEDAERSMISKLKVECGYQFTSKLEGMFHDMRLSADTMHDYQTKLGKENLSHLPSLNVSILTSTFWPITSTLDATIPINYPAEMEALKTRFERFYLARHSGRKLTWLPHMGSADIKAQFTKSKKEINVSTLGAIVLLKMFNTFDDKSISFQDILNETGIPAPDLVRVMQSLSLTKHKVLLKSTKGKEITPSDTFRFNAEFTSPLSKIKILTISSGTSLMNGVENEEERTKTLDKVDEARKHQIEAAIVRIMKSRKSVEHSNLVAEVIDQLKSRFSPSPIMVKKRIEGLIEREYLDRDKEDMRKYIYLA